MSESVDKITEKVYCTNHPGNDNAALCAAMMNRQGENPMEAAALMGGGFGANQWMNNPFAYMMMMFFARMFGFDGYGQNGQNAQNIELQNQLAAIRSQLQDNQNSNLIMDAVKGNAGAIGQLASNLNCDFNTLNTAVCGVKSAVDSVAAATGFSAERVINAAQQGDASIVSALQNCCCQTQQAILKMGYESQLQNASQTNTLQNGQRDLGQAITQGFSSTAYETQKQTCDIIQAGNANTQRIIDTLNIHWNQDLQQRYNDARLELSQQRQNAALIAALKTTSTSSTATT